MSPSNRGSRWSNSGMVVEIHPEDISSADNDALSMMHFQEDIEHTCWQQGNMRQTAPAQRMVDFTRSRLSYDLPGKFVYARSDIQSITFLASHDNRNAFASCVQGVRQEEPWLFDK